MSLSQVLDNFKWRIESLTPTDTTGPTHFEMLDPLRIDESISIDICRKFVISWNGSSDPPSEVEDLADRDAFHDITIEMFYPVGVSGYRWEDAQAMVASDRHLLIKALRNPSNFVGYDADNTATDIGLLHRRLTGDELERDDETDIWTYRASWESLVRESEQ